MKFQPNQQEGEEANHKLDGHIEIAEGQVVEIVEI